MEKLGYRPELDGLRAVAILLVLGVHWWPSVVPGGAGGVDLFFVLSGFLITRLLLEERERSGRVDLRAFWTRRARRLLPAVAVLLVAFCWVPGAWWSAVYLGNWGVIAGEVGEPLRHTWSLAIEEQFYAVWPLVFLVLIRLRRREAVGVLVLGVVAMWALRFDRTGLGIAFGTFTRPDGLLAGCALAFVWPIPRWLRRLWPLAVLVVGTVTLTVKVAPGWSELTTVAFVVCLAAAIDSRWLRWRPLVRVGQLSYSLYLWHYPIAVLLFGGSIDRTPLITALAIVGSVAMALVSERWIERPFRSHAGVVVDRATDADGVVPAGRIERDRMVVHRHHPDRSVEAAGT